MGQFSPAVVLYDSDANPVGIVHDDTFYRLQVEATLAPGENTVGRFKLTDDGEAVASLLLANGHTKVRVSNTEAEFLLKTVIRILRRVETHLEIITDESLGGGN